MVTITATVDRRGEEITISSTLAGDYSDAEEIKRFLKTMTNVWYETHQESRQIAAETMGVQA